MADDVPAPLPADDPGASLASEEATTLEASPPRDPEDDLPRMTLSEHLDELRSRVLRSVLAILVAMIVAFVFHEEIWRFIEAPFIEAALEQGIKDPKLNAHKPGESFYQILKVCFLAGFLFVAPFVIWQMWGFISAGLYPREKRHVRTFFPVSIALFVLGVIAAYVILIPFGLRFLINWDGQLNVDTAYHMEEYVSTCLTLVLGMGLVFELPLLMLFAQATGLVQRETLRKGWRFAVLASVILGMILTDPSPITQIMMAIPIVGLYFMGVWGGRFVGEDAEHFHWWKAWPILLGFAIFVAMIVYAEDLNDLAARMFSYDEVPAAADGATE